MFDNIMNALVMNIFMLATPCYSETKNVMDQNFSKNKFEICIFQMKILTWNRCLLFLNESRPNEVNLQI